MKDEIMFGNLSNLLELEYLSENKVLQYEIFSTYVTNGERFPYKSKFKDYEEFDNYIDIAMNKSIHELNYSEDDKKNIITLSTCVGLKSNARTIVNAKLKDIK